MQENDWRQRNTTPDELRKLTYYEILLVDKTADQKQIRKSYYSLAKTYHPDKNEDPMSEEIFKLINEAYEVLGNEENRKKYDQFGKEGLKDSGFDPTVLIKSMFGGNTFSDFFGELSIIHNLAQMGQQMNNFTTEEEWMNFQIEQEKEKQKFMDEKIKILVKKLEERLDKWVKGKEKEFLKDSMEEIEQCLEVPGGETLLKKVGYIYNLIGRQNSGMLLFQFFAKVQEKGHKAVSKISLIGSAIKLAVNAHKIEGKMQKQQKLEQEKNYTIGNNENQRNPHNPFAKNQTTTTTPTPSQPSYETSNFQNNPNNQNIPNNYPPSYSQNTPNGFENNNNTPNGFENNQPQNSQQQNFQQNFEPQNEQQYQGNNENDPEKAFKDEFGFNEQETQDVMGLMDQGLRLLWKIGLMEIEDCVEIVCTQVCKPKEGITYSKNDKKLLEKKAEGILKLGDLYLKEAEKKSEEEKKLREFENKKRQEQKKTTAKSE